MKFKNTIQHISKWLLTTTSVFTMVMMPVTQGRAAQAAQTGLISKALIQDTVTSMGLNKSTTLSEFYQKNKNLYPPRIQAILEKFVSANKNYVMPQFEITTVKDSDGTEIPTIRVSKDGELINLQMYGNDDRYVKFNNTNFTATDIVNFKDMYLKLYNGNAYLRKQVETANAPASKFTGFPSVTKEIWSKMSIHDKAEYILNMRSLWADAHKVLILKDPKLKRKNSQFEYLWNLISPDAFAQTDSKKRIRQEVKKGSGTTIESSSENCLVAGYVSKYTNGSCGIDAIQDSYKTIDKSGNVIIDPVITKAQSQCSAGSIACNPFIYGMPNGSAKCVPVKDPSFQIATHANGPCDSASPLGTEVNFLNKDLKNNKRYSAENLKLNPEQLSEEYKKQQKNNSAYVEKYLQGFLGAGIDFNSALDNTVLDQILNIKKAFDNDIIKAKESCLAAASSNKYNEKNFWGACDQLQRRFLFVAEFLKEKPGCKDGSIMNDATLKCTCPDTNKTEVNPGAKCAVTAAIEPVVIPPLPPVVEANVKPTPPVKSGEICDGEIISNLNGTEVCIPNKTGTEKNEKPAKEKDSWFTGLFTKILPWVLVPAVLIGMYMWLAPKLKAQPINQPLDSCPNGQPRTNAPCAQPCDAPLSQVNGSCQCASCNPYEVMTNLSTCYCSPKPTTTTPTLITCADGVTKVSNSADCPTTKVTCWDGSTVTNPLYCPTKPANQPPTKVGR